MLYACSNLDLLDKQFEWPILEQVLLTKVKAELNVSHKILIQSMQSFSIAEVGNAEDFWIPLFQIMVPLVEHLTNDDIYLFSNFAHVVASQAAKATPEQLAVFKSVFIQP